MFTATLDVSLGRDRISVSNRETGASINRRSAKPFSSEGRLVANHDEAFAFIAAAIREVDRRPWFRKMFGRVTVRLGDSLNTSGDREDVRKLLVELGATINSID